MGMPSPDMPSPPISKPSMGMPSPGMPSPPISKPSMGMPSPGMPSPDMPLPGMQSPGMSTLPMQSGGDSNSNSSPSLNNLNSNLEDLGSEKPTNSKNSSSTSSGNVVKANHLSDMESSSTSNSTSTKSNTKSSNNSKEPMQSNIAMNNLAMHNLSKTPLLKNDLLAQFIDFVKTHSKIAKFDPKNLDNYGMTELAASAFKGPLNYDPTDPNTGKLSISEEKMDSFCVKNTIDKVIKINLDDAKFADLINIYSDMKTKYINNCEALLSILENHILTKVGSESNMRFTIKDIGYADLVEQETNVRNNIGNMYAECHLNYQSGISALYSALTS